MSQSTKRRTTGKPAKPYPDFPLFPHATRRWAKKIRGKHFYFGPWEDPDGALQQYLNQKDDLYAGRVPRVAGDGLTLRDLCNAFLRSKRLRVDSGDLNERTFRDYLKSCERLIEAFGKQRLVEDLGPDDFERLRASLAENWGPVTLGNEIQRMRVVLKYAVDQQLVEEAIRYGHGFRQPNRKVLRKARAAKGPRMFDADELKQIVEAAPRRSRR